jgi:hypothetical protein
MTKKIKEFLTETPKKILIPEIPWDKNHRALAGKKGNWGDYLGPTATNDMYDQWVGMVANRRGTWIHVAEYGRRKTELKMLKMGAKVG